MCAFSMCAHVSLRAHRRRAFASRASFQAWNPHCLASFGSIVRLLYIYMCVCIFVSILCLYYTIALWCKILQVGGSLLGSAARVFLARMRAGMAARPVCARTCARSFQAWNPTMAILIALQALST